MPMVGQEHVDAVRDALTPRGTVLLGDEQRRAIEETRTQVYGKLRIALLNAIPHEYAAILAIFGDEKAIPSRDYADSTIKYVTVSLASGESIHVVLAGVTGQGIAQAAAAAAQIKHRCRFVDKIILVGIAAGQPNLVDKEKDVRLGDVVVGNRVVQYDHVKLTDDGQEFRGDKLQPGDSALMTVVDRLRARQDFKVEAGREKPWVRHISEGTKAIRNASRPPPEADPHASRRSYTKGMEYERPDDDCFVHVGTIGSASTLLKNAKFRDDLNAKYSTIAYEMEGAGLAIAAAASGVDYLMVRGICDYGDANKDDRWQTYASVCAAAFARSVLEAQ